MSDEAQRRKGLELLRHVCLVRAKRSNDEIDIDFSVMFVLGAQAQIEEREEGATDEH